MVAGSHAGIETAVDVAVVGAGPAGCAAAISAAERGLRVSVIDSERHPRVRPGESLHPGVMAIFRQLGVAEEVEAAGFRRFARQSVSWGEPAAFQSFGSTDGIAWSGLQAARPQLDAILHRRLAELGVVRLSGCRALEVLQNGSRVSGIRTDQGTIVASYVVDAGGGAHWLGRRLGCGVFCASRRLIAYWTHGDSPASADHPTLVADSTGWTWTAPLDSSRTAWVRMPFHVNAKPPLRIEEAAPWRGTDVTWRIVPESAGPGWFLVGDAAQVLDPLTSRGVLRGMMSGILAVHYLARILDHPKEERVALQFYRESCIQGFRREVEALRQLYEALPARWRVDLRPNPSVSTPHGLGKVICGENGPHQHP